MWEKICGYLTFTRKERYGVLFLLLLIIVFFILPYFFKRSPGDPDPETYKKIQSEIQTFVSRVPDSALEKNNHKFRQTIFPTNLNQANAVDHSRIQMFYFDPNKIAEADWIQLGLHERLAATIRHYLEKGGRFGKAEDLKKLYGLHDDDYERLYPFVRIAPSKEKFGFRPGKDKTTGDYASAVRKSDSSLHAAMPGPVQPFRHNAKMFAEIDVNVSDSSEWSSLPGIGEKLASRIIHFREKLGGFYQSDQVAEVYGLPDTTFRKIRPYLKMQPVSLRQININAATKEILISHPYIRWPLARSIIEYRLQHGSFHAIDELLQLAQMDAALFEKLKPYLKTNDIAP